MDQTVCVRPPANIGPGGQRKRGIIGAVALIAAIGVGYVLYSPELPHAYRLVVGLPLFVAISALLQAQQKT